MLVGCGESAEQRLLGTWHAELDQEGLDVGVDGDLAAAVSAVMAEDTDVILEFRPESAMEMHMALGPMKVVLQGDWAILGDSGETALLEIRTRYPQSEETKSRRGTVAFLNAGAIAFTPADSETATDDPLSRKLKLVRRSD